MTRLLKNLLSLLLMGLVFMALLVCIDTVRGTDFPPSQGYYVKDIRNLCDRNADGGILILGNSRALSSLSAPVLAAATGLKTYNLAVRSADLTTTRLELETYLANCRTKPRYCLLEISWFSFNRNRTVFNLDLATDLLLKDSHALKYLWAHPEMLQFEVLKSELNAVALVEDVAQGHAPGKAGKDYIDYDANLNHKPKTGPLFDRAEMEREFPGGVAGIDEELLSDFVEIVRTCRANGIDLIVYDAPEDPDYTRAQKDRPVIKEKILSVLRGADNTFFDFTIDGKYWNPAFTGELYDSHHLNNPDNFTRFFAQTVLPTLSRPSAMAAK